MISTTTALLIATVAISAGGAAYSAVQSKKAADEQEDMLNEQARQEREAATAEAGKIGDRARRLMGSQRTALAASGVQLDDSGSGDILVDETQRLAEQDALAVLQEGSNRAGLLNMEARSAGRRGTAALVSGAFNVASSVASGYKGYLSANASTNFAGDVAAQANAKSGAGYSLLSGRYSLGEAGKLSTSGL